MQEYCLILGYVYSKTHPNSYTVLQFLVQDSTSYTRTPIILFLPVVLFSCTQTHAKIPGKRDKDIILRDICRTVTFRHLA